MATTTSTRGRKRAPLHPAIVALRSAHQEFRAWKHGDVGSCFDSDLRHDERMVTAHPDHAFVWLISPHGTHACRLGSENDCYADITSKPWERSSIGMYLQSVCVGCYAPEAIPEGWLRLYVWDGRALERYESLAALRRRISRVVIQRACSFIADRAVIVREHLMALASMGSDTSHAERHLADLTNESSSISLSGWGAIDNANNAYPREF